MGLQRVLPLTSCPCLCCDSLISGLLYQEYRDKSTLQEIETRRQQDAEIQSNSDGSQAGEDTPEEEEEEEEELASPPERRALPQICLLSNPHSRFNLWQDLPEIQSSGVLDILQPEEVKLQEVMHVPGGGGRRYRESGDSSAELRFPAGELEQFRTDRFCVTQIAKETFHKSQTTWPLSALAQCSR